MNRNLEQEIHDLKSVLETEYGKRFLMRLIERAGVFQPTYGSGTNPSDFAFFEGRREMGLFIMGEITKVDSSAWVSMQKDHFEKIQETDEKVRNEREQQRASSND